MPIRTTEPREAPYFDDFDEDKQFHRILFRPSMAVQARELTQLQTIIEDQIEKFGTHVFKENTMVIPGYLKLFTDTDYVAILHDELYTEDFLANNVVGKQIKAVRDVDGTPTDIIATVLFCLSPDENDSNHDIWFLKYDTASGEVDANPEATETSRNNILPTDLVLSDVETAAAGSHGSYSFTIASDVGAATGKIKVNTDLPTEYEVGAVGKGSTATIENGVYFVRGHFVKVYADQIALDPFSQTPSYRVGFDITEDVVTEEQDPSLNDLAQGSPNLFAPGAHRLRIRTTLSKKEILGEDVIDPDSDTFVPLARIIDGILEKLVVRTDYNILGDNLAERTFDESGDYTVDPFLVDIIGYTDQEVEDDENLPLVDQQGLRNKVKLGIEAGKAYVKGYLIETLAKNFLDISKARTSMWTNNGAVETDLGNYVRVTNIASLPNLSEYEEVSFYEDLTSPKYPDGSPLDPDGGGPATIIGTARVRGFELHAGSHGEDSAVYRLYLFDIETIPGKTFANVEHIRGSGGFSANVAQTPTNLRGTAQGSGTTLSGSGTLWNSGRDDEGIIAGDWIQMTGENNESPTYHYVRSVASNVSATIWPAATIAGDVVVARLFSRLEKTQGTRAIFPMPHRAIKTIRSADEEGTIQDGINDTSYIVRRVKNATVNGTTVTINGETGESFEPFSQRNYVVSLDNSAGGYDTGHVFSINDASGSDVLINIGTDITMDFPAGLNGEAVTVITTLRKLTANEGSKTPTLSTPHTTSASQQNLSEVLLPHHDVYEIVEVKMASSFGSTDYDEDIKDRFDLDNGQRDNYYDFAKLILKAGARPPKGALSIRYRYFQHTASSNYFSCDSYTGLATAGSDPALYDHLDKIPSFQSPEQGLGYDLRDSLDFRPVKNSSGGFDAGARIEYPISNILTDYHHYMHRIDLIYLNRDGTFGIKKGVPSLNPKIPESPEEAMVLYQAKVRAFTAEPKDDILLKFIENKRYTMRDIGKLETRIEKLEYYTALSLLEKETEDMKILDSEGNDRFKNGFLVDPFTMHGSPNGKGDYENPDHRIAVDPAEGEARPVFFQDNVDIVEDGTNTSYQWSKNKEIITLPFTSVPYVDQPYATNADSINPFDVVKYIGKITLTPSLDEWKDTKRVPDLQVEQEGNYEAMKKMAENNGIVWRDWQTNWYGITQDTEVEVTQTVEPADRIMRHRELDGTLSEDPNWINVRPDGTLWDWPHKVTTTTRTTTTTHTPQSRRGVRSKVTPKIIRKNLGDKVIDVAYIPFMRTKDVVFRVKGLRPNTVVYPFFDQIDIKQHVSFAGTGNENPPIGSEPTYDAGNTVDGPDKLKTDAGGNCAGVFRIPNSDALKFKTGQRVFRLTDRANNDTKWECSAEAVYRAQGLLETKQRTILSTRNAVVTEEVFIDTRINTKVEIDEKVDVVYVDPIAQSFNIDTKGGIFITKIDVFFEGKHDSVPVEIQVREMENGYPGKRVLPFGQVLLTPDEVSISYEDNGTLKTEVAPNGNFGTAGDNDYIDSSAFAGDKVDYDSTNLIPTRFEFDAPLFLQNGAEYCFVLMSNSNFYKAWLSTMEHVDPATGIVYKMVGTDLPVTKQPHTGSYFKSQNSSTWTADQFVDIKFKIYRAEFAEAAGTLRVANDVLPSTVLDGNPIQFKENSSLVRVIHRNHGHLGIPTIGGPTPPQWVTIDGIIEGPTEGGTGNIYGVPIAALNTTHQILWADLDSYVIDCGSAADRSDRGGGDNVIASENKPYELIHPKFATLQVPGTNVTMDMKTTTYGSVHSDEYTQVQGRIDTVWTPIIPNEDIGFGSPRVIFSGINEDNALINPTQGPASLQFQFILSRDANLPNVSPVIDMKRLNVTVVHNRLDDPDWLPGYYDIATNDEPAETFVRSVNCMGFDDIDLVAESGSDGSTITLAGDTIVGTGSATATHLARVQVGKYIEIRGSASDDEYYRVTSVVHDLGSNTTTITVDGTFAGDSANASLKVILWDRYVSELAPLHGSTSSKYVCRRLILTAPSNALRVSFAAFRPVHANVDLYYKISKVDDATPFDQIPYIKVDPDQPVGAAVNDGIFREYEFTIDNNGNGLDDFTAAACKIVLRGSNPAVVPRVTDFRMIALDK